ncbi:helix-turn-helix domain-containing protein [Streptomyces sp. NPDC054841]
MTDPQLNAPSCAPPPVHRPGIQHFNVRHTERFVVVGNHLVQHTELSLTAIGLAVHIQSLPAGARISIKRLTERFPEGEIRIAAALRELEEHGYLARIQVRLPSGTVITLTLSYNNPSAMRAEPEPQTERAPGPEPTPAPPPPEPEAAPSMPAIALLSGLRRDDPRLILAERDVRRLAPAVDTWLERGIAPDAVRRTLIAALPPGRIHYPAALLSHRLTALLPPPLPAAPVPPPRPDPLQNCDRCDRAFRAAEPGFCRDCDTPAVSSALAA